jgi:hypothetical protein
MKSTSIAAAGVIVAGLAAWQGAIAWQDTTDPKPSTTAPVAAPAATSDTPASAQTNPALSDAPISDKVTTIDPEAGMVKATTPMEQRVAVLGVLNKRNGIARDITIKPGQAIRMGDLIVRLRACETSAPWEHEQLTGAFVQTDVRGRDDKWRRVFSGWLYAESPSLNVVEHSVYDVWPKSCTMRWPEAGPDTITAAAPAGDGKKSSAKKSGGGAPAPAPSAPAPVTAPATAPASNPT